MEKIKQNQIVNCIQSGFGFYRFSLIFTTAICIAFRYNKVAADTGTGYD
jgi:hypothetical protein